MYDEEPAEENTIFKDLDLNENTDSIGSSVNMDVFDESNLEELTLDEDTEIEDDESEEIAEETEVAEEAAGEIKAATEIKIETPEDDREAEGMTEMLAS